MSLPEFMRPKEAHVIAALNAAAAAHGLDVSEPSVIEVVETDDRGRARLVRQDNTKEHRALAFERHSLEEAFLTGSLPKHRAHLGACHDPKEAHVIEGDSAATGARIEAQLRARKDRLALERKARVDALALELDKDPAAAKRLARTAAPDELVDALAALGVLPEGK